MLAVQVANKKLNPVTKPLPKLRLGWALVRVRLAGICNTDVEILRGYLKAQFPHQNLYNRAGLSTSIFRRTAASGVQTGNWFSNRPSSICMSGVTSVALRPACAAVLGCGQSEPHNTLSAFAPISARASGITSA